MEELHILKKKSLQAYRKITCLQLSKFSKLDPLSLVKFFKTHLISLKKWPQDFGNCEGLQQVTIGLYRMFSPYFKRFVGSSHFCFGALISVVSIDLGTRDKLNKKKHLF
jgi:hypothetical protein